jgi:hypothetical protein
MRNGHGAPLPANIDFWQGNRMRKSVRAQKNEADDDGGDGCREAASAHFVGSHASALL